LADGLNKNRLVISGLQAFATQILTILHTSVVNR
jgi:hypothetical protein